MRKTYKLSKNSIKTPLTASQNYLFQAYMKNKDDFDNLKVLIEKIHDSTGLDENQILMSVKTRPVLVPLSIFNNNLAPLEAVTLFLKENLGYTLHGAARCLSRDDRTVWLTYSNAKKKNVQIETDSQYYIPVLLFSDRSYSILELAVSYLKDNINLSIKEISCLTNKSPKTIWTVYSRYKKKKNET